MSEWEKVKLQDVIDLIRNGTTEYQSDNVSEYPVTRIETISQGIIDYDRVRYLEKAKPEFQLISGDILYSHINSIQHIGKTAQYFAEKPLYHGMNLMLLRVKNEIDARFIFYILNTEIARRHSKNEAKPAINQASLGQKEILRFSFDLPSLLTEQRKIARILSTVDAVIEKTEAAIAKYEAIKKGMMADLFTRGIDPATGKLRPRYEDEPELYKETELGWVPKEWEVESVKSLSIGGLKNGYFKKPELVGRGLKLVNVTDLYQPFRLNIYEHKVERVEASQEDYIKYAVAPGDIFFTRSSLVLDGIAHCNILVKLPEKAIYECHIMRLRPNQQKINPLFLAYFCRTHYARRYFMTIAKQVTMVTISQPDIEKFLVAFPRSIEEQEIIAGKIQSCDDKLCNERVSLKKYNNLKQGLMADLLTGRVRVKVAEEPAVEMAEVSNG